LDTFTIVVSLILLTFPFFDWTAVHILNKASSQASHSNIALKERARISIILALATSINSIFALAALTSIRLGPQIFIPLLAVSFILVGLPNLYWLSLYYRNKLRK